MKSAAIACAALLLSIPGASHGQDRPGLADAPVGVTAAHDYTCVVTRGGRARCWGHNTSGQLGARRRSERETAPVPVGATARFRAVSGGGWHACALDADGVAWCWGENLYTLPDGGHLFDGVKPPTRVRGAVRFSALEAHRSNTCALSNGGRVYCWGGNEDAQLGSFALRLSRTPVRVPLPARAAQVTVGGMHVCARLDGGAYCWGNNDHGQAGVQPPPFRPAPGMVPGVPALSDLSAGGHHTCGVTTGGEVYCWGANDFGQLGVAPASAIAEPTRVPGLTGAASVHAGTHHTCALLASGEAVCWGDASLGQTGTGSFGRDDEPEPPRPVAGGLRFARLDAGTQHTCGITRGGEVYCWGSNSEGQLGNGTRETSAVPVRVIGSPGG